MLLKLNRAPRMNAFTVGMMQEMHNAIDTIAVDRSLRALVIAGEGPAFCSGLDLKALPPALLGTSASVVAWTEIQQLFSGMSRKLRALDQVVIAAVQGAAVGAGFAMALAADIRVAARSAAFHIGAVKIGLSAGECGISYHLPKIVGSARAFELMLTGRPLLADEAERIGLVASVVEEAALVESALELATQVLRNSPYSTRHTKQLMWANLEAPSLEAALQLEDRTQVMALQTADFREAVAAFTEKRPPHFNGT
ncbi:enoyl-CoA hydratase/isomerase family protein [Hydrogenophaga sp. BPS33]|uniref:enoyl-CoA hydratase/isomerase family protein n=1 Tax=Hydrogenophaga sp. BPS33 TaxID=2651974 RepID=UPI00191758A2|nr:enoyl-CoA hydratase-related protein [Hydrogenophaga sp. BPS33]